MFSWVGRAGAQNGLYWSEIALLIVTAIVVAGLIGEYRKDREERWKGFSDLFEMLVIVGVIGEVVCDGLIFGFSGRLEVIQDAAVGAAKTEAAVAHRQAKEASISAAVALRDAGSAINNAHEAAANAQAASTQAKEASRDANDAARKAEDAAKQAQDAATNALIALNEDATLREQLATQQLRLQETVKTEAKTQQTVGVVVKKIADRDIKDKQRRIVIDGINGHRRPVVVVRLDDPEPHAYGDMIAGLLTDAHFEVHKADFGGRTSPEKGVIVCINGPRDRKLFRVLDRAEIATGSRPSNDDSDPNNPTECPKTDWIFSDPKMRGAARIFVGHQPKQ